MSETLRYWGLRGMTAHVKKRMVLFVTNSVSPDTIAIMLHLQNVIKMFPCALRMQCSQLNSRRLESINGKTEMVLSSYCQHW